MKIICLVLLFSVNIINAADPTPDYRELYDKLLLELINERIREGEQFLSHLGHQLTEYQKTKDETLRVNIQKELEFILPLVKETDVILTAELKKTGLDLMERYSLEKAKSDADIVVKLLTEVQKQTAKPPTYYADDKVDWRQEYDRLLYASIQEHILRADGLLLQLNTELAEFLKTKSADIKTRITEQIELIVPFLKLADDQALTELKRTDLDLLERFLYEKSDDEIKLLLRHYSEIEKQVNGGKVLSDLSDIDAPAADPPVDWRAEYDKLLFAFVEENVRRADDLLVELVRQVNEYKTTKNKDLIDRVTREVEFTVPLVNRAIDMAETQLKRTDLNHIERYMFEKVRDEAKILEKYYKQLEAEVKKP